MIADPQTVIVCLNNIKPRKRYDLEWIVNACDTIRHQAEVIAAQRKQLAALQAKAKPEAGKGGAP